MFNFVRFRKNRAIPFDAPLHKSLHTFSDIELNFYFDETYLQLKMMVTRKCFQTYVQVIVNTASDAFTLYAHTTCNQNLVRN